MNEDPRMDALVEVFLTGVKGLLEFYHLYSASHNCTVALVPKWYMSHHLTLKRQSRS